MPKALKPVQRKQEPESFDLAQRVSDWLDLQTLAKQSYKTLDQNMDALKKLIKVGQVLTLPNGKKVKMTDTWRGKNRVNGGMNIRRWALEDVIE